MTSPTVSFSLLQHRLRRVVIGRALDVAAVAGGGATVARPFSGDGRGDRVLVGADLTEAVPQSTDASDVDHNDEEKREVVDDHGHREDVRGRWEKEAFVDDGRRHRAIIEDAGQPYGATYRYSMGR